MSMRPDSGLRTFLLFLAPLFLFVVSALVFALEFISTTLFNVHTTRDWPYGRRIITLYGPTKTGASPDDYDYIDVDINLNATPTIAFLCVSVFAGIISCLDACAVWELRRVEGSARQQRGWSWFALLANLLVLALSVGVLAWASVLVGNEGWKGYGDVIEEGQKWTKETWICQIDRLFPRQDWGATACGTARATRFMLIAIAVGSILVMGALWVLVHQRGGFKWLFGGKGRYAGFTSVQETNTQQAPTYPLQPMYVRPPVYVQVPVYPQSPGYPPQGAWPQSPGFVPLQQPLYPGFAAQPQPFHPGFVPQQQPFNPGFVPQQQPLSPTSVPQQQPLSPTSVPQQQPLSPTSVPQQQPQPESAISQQPQAPPVPPPTEKAAGTTPTTYR